MPNGSAAPPPRILLAEEQAAARDLVTLVLGRRHYRIESVASGGSALALARRDPADLILLSTTLPDMPGPPLIGALRELPGARAGADRRHLPGRCGGSAGLHGGRRGGMPRSSARDRASRRSDRAPGPAPRPSRGPRPRAGARSGSLRGFTDGDPQLEGELSALFLSTAEVYLRDMREALQRGGPGPRPRMRSRVRAPISAPAASPPGARGRALGAEPGPARRDRTAIDEVRAFFERSSAISDRGDEHEGTSGIAARNPLIYAFI